MKKLQMNIIEELRNNFDVLWEGFSIQIPIIKSIIKNKDLSKFQNRFIEKYSLMCKSKVNLVTSNCLLERYISSLSYSPIADQFEQEIVAIASEIEKSLRISENNISIANKIKDIIRNMVLSIDTDPNSKNSDYRNRLNEIVVYNILSECENMKLLSIEKPLGNGKSCDFECVSKDNKKILLEVLSINNLDINKQESSQSFSDFINQKVEKKYNDKTQGLLEIPNIYIMPILENKEDLKKHNITTNSNISTPPFTVVINIVDNTAKLELCFLSDLKKQS